MPRAKSGPPHVPPAVRSRSIGSRAPADSNVILRITSQTTGLGIGAPAAVGAAAALAAAVGHARRQDPAADSLAIAMHRAILRASLTALGADQL
jgi:hypothetical protein